MVHPSTLQKPLTHPFTRSFTVVLPRVLVYKIYANSVSTLMDEFNTQSRVKVPTVFQQSEGSYWLQVAWCTLHIMCSHTTDWGLASLERLKWLELGSKATCSIHAPFLAHLWPTMYWMKWNDVTLSFLSVLSEVIAPCCATILKDLKVPCVWAAKLPRSCLLSSHKKSSHQKPTRLRLLYNVRILPLEREKEHFEELL